MGCFEKSLFDSLTSDENIIPKAIANFMFREVIEDAHTKYGISQEDICEMCKEAVNRAAVLEKALIDEELKNALILYGYSTSQWDNPDSASVETKLKEFRGVSGYISKL